MTFFLVVGQLYQILKTPVAQFMATIKIFPAHYTCSDGVCKGYSTEEKGTFDSFAMACSLDDRCNAFSYHEDGYGYLCEKIFKVGNELEGYKFCVLDQG